MQENILTNDASLETSRSSVGSEGSAGIEGRRLSRGDGNDDTKVENRMS